MFVYVLVILQIIEVLHKASDPDLDLSDPLPSFINHLVAFNQANIKASRKKVLPVLKSFLDIGANADNRLP